MATDGPGGPVLFGGLYFRNTTNATPAFRTDTWRFTNGDWVNGTGPTVPALGGFSDLLAYDVARQSVISVARGNASYVSNSTWEFANGSWSILPVTGVLPDVGGQLLCTDSAANEVIDVPFPLGLTNGTLSTYGLNGTTWSRDSEENFTPPPPRAHPGLGYDPSTSSAVLFGGMNSTSPINDTWLFGANGSSSALNRSVAPSPRDGLGFVFDSTLGRSILFGGGDYVGPGTNDTWSFANGNWSRVPTTTAPPMERYGCLSDDPANGGILLFGGLNNGGGAMNETWVWNVTGWHDLSGGPAPSPRGFSACAWDPSAREVLLVGGATTTSFDFPTGTIDPDTWGFSGTGWTRLSVVGPLGAPSADGTLLPAPGTSGMTLALLPGWNGTSVATGTPEWTGSAWGSSAVPAGQTPSFEGAAGVFDPALGASLVLSGLYARGPGRPAYLLSEAFVLDPLVIVGSVDASSALTSGTAIFSVSLSSGGLPARYSWDFGDGSGSIAASGSHSYSRAGTYTGSVTVVDRWGAEATWSFQVTVTTGSGGGLTLANSTLAPLSGASPLTVAFLGNATGGTPPYLFRWTFGDGTVSRSASGTHSYTSDGTFPVELVVNDSAGNAGWREWNVTVSPFGLSHPIRLGGGVAIPFAVWLAAGTGAAVVGAILGWWGYRRRVKGTVEADQDPAETFQEESPPSDEPPDGDYPARSTNGPL